MRGLAAQRLLPGEGDDIELAPIERLREGGRGRVADRQSGPVGGDPIGVGDPYPRRRAVPGEDDVACRIDLGKVGQFAVAGLQHGRVFELELLDDVGHPAFAEGFPGQHGHRARAQQRPQRHFDGAGIGGRHDADAIIGGNLQNLTGEIDGALEPRLADFRAMRAAKDGAAEGLRGPAGALGAGAG